ncbi:MAG: hypothetical protein DK306_001929 [Chloroflexi bacterium]|jgi:hypothetical protein|nr:MAG: hypothetical protein DK306_001929 [Chloroflexota bacterium]
MYPNPLKQKMVAGQVILGSPLNFDIRDVNDCFRAYRAQAAQ